MLPKESLQYVNKGHMFESNVYLGAGVFSSSQEKGDFKLMIAQSFCEAEFWTQNVTGGTAGN